MGEEQEQMMFIDYETSEAIAREVIQQYDETQEQK